MGLAQRCEVLARLVVADVEEVLRLAVARAPYGVGLLPGAVARDDDAAAVHAPARHRVARGRLADGDHRGRAARGAAVGDARVGPVATVEALGQTLEREVVDRDDLRAARGAAVRGQRVMQDVGVARAGTARQLDRRPVGVGRPVQPAARAAAGGRTARRVRGLDDLDPRFVQRADHALDVHACAAVAAHGERRVDEDANGAHSRGADGDGAPTA